MEGVAYLSILTPALSINGFECCGLWPFESEIFQSEAFAAFKSTDEPKIQDEALSEGEGVSSKHPWAQVERQSRGASTSGISSRKIESLKASRTDE